MLVCGALRVACGHAHNAACRRKKDRAVEIIFFKTSSLQEEPLIIGVRTRRPLRVLRRLRAWSDGGGNRQIGEGMLGLSLQCNRQR